MGNRLLVLALATVLSSPCVGGAGAALPTSPDIAITPPAPDLALELAAFSGIREGVWDGVLPSRLIVERIDATSARVVYIWGAHPDGNFQAGYSRRNAKVLPGGKIEFGGAGRPYFVFTMSRDRTSIAGARESQGQVATTTMKRVAEQ